MHNKYYELPPPPDNDDDNFKELWNDTFKDRENFIAGLWNAFGFTLVLIVFGWFVLAGIPWIIANAPEGGR